MAEETVLVVDDNREIVYSISELLKYEGYRTLAAYDGMEALELLEAQPVDLIILDVMMPKMNGLSALMKLREKHRIPVIILSAKTRPGHGRGRLCGEALQPGGADGPGESPPAPVPGLGRAGAGAGRGPAGKRGPGAG